VKRLIFPLAAALALSVLPAVAQGTDPVDPVLTQATAGGRTYTMNPMCALEVFLVGRSDSIDGTSVTVRPFFRTLRGGWESGLPYETAETGDLVGAKLGAAFCVESATS
jgi:hypothetical protein